MSQKEKIPLKVDSHTSLKLVNEYPANDKQEPASTH